MNLKDKFEEQVCIKCDRKPTCRQTYIASCATLLIWDKLINSNK